MNNRSSRRGVSLRSALLVIALIVCPLAAPRVAQAADPLGFYIGAAYGQAHIRAQDPLISSGFVFDSTHSAYQGMLGIRPISFMGGEITYVDFGQGSLRFQGVDTVTNSQISQKGEAAYALLYLPVPVVDVYVKAGMSRITTDTTATFTSFPGRSTQTVRGSSTDTSFAYGAGLQWKLGQWAVRGEYERFSAAGANPTLLSLGMTYWLQ